MSQPAASTRLQAQLAGFDDIDGMTPYISETAPTLNLRASLSEGQARIVAPDPDRPRRVRPVHPPLRPTLPPRRPAAGGVLVNEEAVDALDAQVGDTLRLFLPGGIVDVRVEGVVENGGLAGIDTTILMPLAAAQEAFGKEGQINSIAISNRGGALSGADLSHDVTNKLRVIFADPQVVEELKLLLNKPEVLTQLEGHEAGLGGEHKEDMEILRQELVRPQVSDELVRVLSDEDVRAGVLDALASGGLTQTWRKKPTPFSAICRKCPCSKSNASSWTCPTMPPVAQPPYSSSSASSP